MWGDRCSRLCSSYRRFCVDPGDEQEEEEEEEAEYNDLLHSIFSMLF